MKNLTIGAASLRLEQEKDFDSVIPKGKHCIDSQNKLCPFWALHLDNTRGYCALMGQFDETPYGLLWSYEKLCEK